MTQVTSLTALSFEERKTGLILSLSILIAHLESVLN